MESTPETIAVQARCVMCIFAFLHVPTPGAAQVTFHGTPRGPQAWNPTSMVPALWFVKEIAGYSVQGGDIIIYSSGFQIHSACFFINFTFFWPS